MKKILIIISFLTIFTLLVSCNNDNANEATNEVTNEEAAENEEAKYVIYADFSLGVSSSIEGISEQVSIKSATEKTFTFSKKD
jgi:uncharacterized alpha/beta hydrolase family protein